MPTTVQFRRGTTAQNNSFTGAQGEISVNTSNNTLRVHDGVTAGGTELITTSSLTTANTTEISNLYFTNARVYSNVINLGYATNSNVALKANVADLTTANVVENTNLYFSNTRVYSNVINLGYATNSNVALKANVADLTTANVVENTNLYFTNARVYSNVTQLGYLSSSSTINSSQLSSNLVLGGTVTYLGSAVERANVQVATVTSNIIFNPYSQAILYFSANTNTNTTVTVNFTGIGNLTTGNVLSATILLTNNATYNAYISAVQIDGSAVSTSGIGSTVLSGGTPSGNTIRWQSSVPTSGTANVEIYSFSIFKQAANSYIVLGSKSNFN